MIKQGTQRRAGTKPACDWTPQRALLIGRESQSPRRGVEAKTVPALSLSGILLVTHPVKPARSQSLVPEFGS